MAIQLHDSFFTHPGPWLKTEIIDAHQLQIVDAAKRLHVTRQALSALVNGRAGLSAEMAIRFEKVFGLDAATSLQMQTCYDLAQARARTDEIIVEGALAAACASRPDPGETMSDVGTIPFDPMDHLDTIEDQVELLNDALATGDASVIGNIIGMIAAKRGIANLSRDTGIGRSSLYNAVGADANPTLGTLLKVLDGLGLGLRATARGATAAHA